MLATLIIWGFSKRIEFLHYTDFQCMSIRGQVLFDTLHEKNNCYSMSIGFLEHIKME